MPAKFCTGFAAAVLVSTLLFGEPAKADEDTTTGNYLFEGCNAFAQDTLQGITETDSISAIHTEINQNTKAWLCAGAIMGVLYMGELDHQLCVPTDVTNGQMLKVVVKYMGDHPDHLNWRYTALIFDALHAAWPCPQK